MSLLKDLDDSLFIMSSENYITRYIALILTFVGLSLSLLVFYHTRDDYSPRNILNWSLLSADFLLCSFCFVITISDLIQGRLSTGPIGCLTSQFVLCTTTGASLFSLFAISVERYSSIKFRYDTTRRDAISIVAFIWILMIVTSAMPWYSQSYPYSVALMPSKLYCNTAYWVLLRISS
jgi:hypothetical protein